MTYGEWIYEHHSDLKIEDGEWTGYRGLRPQQMPKDDAVAYYSKKLDEAWKKEGYKKSRSFTLSLEFVQKKIIEAYEAGFSDTKEVS
ncbi:hypothetical protein [Hydrogenimonas sp.]